MANYVTFAPLFFPCFDIDNFPLSITDEVENFDSAAHLLHMYSKNVLDLIRFKIYENLNIVVEHLK